MGIKQARRRTDPNEYSPIVLDHFERPRNVGELADADGIGTAGDAGCGDTMTIWIRVRDDVIEDISFKCKGCPAAIACGSMTTELARGKHLDDAAEIADETIAEALGGLSPEKRHCSNLGAAALTNAFWDYIVRWVEGQAGQAPARQ